MSRRNINQATNIRIRFHGTLNDFLPFARRRVWVPLVVNDHPAVKDPLESLGVPHPEIARIAINGVPARFSRHVRDGDRIEAFPAGKNPILPAPRAARRPRFAVDSHLGKLARRLRLLGFDCLYKTVYTDADIASDAERERRIVLTRDVGLLKHKRIRRGYWVRAIRPGRQLEEVIRRFALHGQGRPFRICLTCNGRIAAVLKKTVLGQLPPKVRSLDVPFFRCRSCRKVYWPGAHHKELKRWIRQLDKA